jgi:molecular chaperone GrpE
MKKHPEEEVLDAAGAADAKAKGEPGPASDGPAEETGVAAVEAPPESEALKRERDELKDQLLRRRADFDNYRKRVERDKELATLEARAQILAGLLPTVDNFERALLAPAAAGDDASLRTGVELIYRNLMSFLESQGVVIKDPTGEMFDPEVHQALMHEPAPGFADGTIVEVFRKAYFLKDRLLRPALVKVAKGADADESSTGTAH